MKVRLTIQEKLKDLRVQRGLTLEELEAKVNISKSTLGSYESNDYKDISHTSLMILAKYYGVCLVHNKNTQNCRGASSKLQREFPQ